MGLFDIGKPKITTEQWLRFALDQLFSEKWTHTQKKFYVWTKENDIANELSEQSFVEEIFGAQLQLLALVCCRINYNLGMDVVFFIDEYLKKLSHNTAEKVQEAYDYSHRKTSGFSDISTYTLLANACSERLNIKSSIFIERLELEFAALAERWFVDAGKYKFIAI